MSTMMQPYSVAEADGAPRARGAVKAQWVWAYRLGLALLPLVLTLGFYYRPFFQGSPLPMGGDRDFYVYELTRMGELTGRWWKLGYDDLLGQPYHSQMAHHPQLYEGVDLLLLSSLSARFLDPATNYHALSVLVLVINGWVAAWLVLRITSSYGWAALATVLITLNVCTDVRLAGHLHLFKYGWMLLAVWAFLRYLDAPTLGRGILLGLLLALVLASSFYWGFFVLVCLGVWWLGCLIAGSLSRQHWLAAGAAGAAFALVGAVVTFPIWRPSFRANVNAAEYFVRDPHELWDYSTEPWQYFVSPFWPSAAKYFLRPEWDGGEGWSYPGLVVLFALGAYLLARLRGWQLDDGRPRYLGRLLGLSAILVILSLWGGPGLLIYKLVPTFRCYGRAGMLAVGLWCVAAPVILFGLAQRLRWAPLRLALLGGALALALYEGESQFGKGGANYHGINRTHPDPTWATWLATQPADVRLAVFPLDYYDALNPPIPDERNGDSPYYAAYLRCLHRHTTLNGCNSHELSADLAETGSTLGSVNVAGLSQIVALGYNTLAFHRDYLQSHPWIETLTGLEPVQVLEEWHIYRVIEPPDMPPYRPGTRIHFTNAFSGALLGGGWYEREDNLRWSAAQATLRFKLERLRPLRLRMMSTTFGKQRVIVGLNGRQINTFQQNGEGLELIEFDLPSGVLAAGSTLTFTLPDAQSPKTAGVSEDERILGLAIAWMELVPTD